MIKLVYFARCNARTNYKYGRHNNFYTNWHSDLCCHRKKGQEMKITNNDVGRSIIFIPKQEQYRIQVIHNEFAYILNNGILRGKKISELENSKEWCWYKSKEE